MLVQTAQIYRGANGDDAIAEGRQPDQTVLFVGFSIKWAYGAMRFLFVDPSGAEILVTITERDRLIAAPVC